jgi:hypothetical protein
MRIPLIALFLFLLSGMAVGQTCKSNQYDMLDWMLPQQSTVNGHYNVLYPDSGTFYWVKGNKGYPWDVDTFDSKFIYQSITEQIWNDPTTYKIFQTPLPWMPRCIDIPSVPGKLASITVDPTKTWFDIHTSCANFTTHNLGYVVNEIWGPSVQTIGNLPPAPTLSLSYRYSCDSQYNNCHYKESFAMQKGKGLVRWTYYALQNGQYAQVNQVFHSTVTLGSVAPVHPCW